MHKIYVYSYFYNGISDSVFRFLLNRSIFEKTIKKHSSQFSDKREEKVIRENTFLLKLDFCNADRKMKNIIRCIFISIIMHPNFVHFRQKISFKRALENFTPVSGHSKTALITNSQ